ncbi:hypothetical protein [Nocardia sp. XZ_19_369]|uniref:hypothetical protein n=1 Tax=Nocardia sp. XZ_19_369 TaxID=2769487 RepID=UPI00188E2E21|nr:hypothetical protein [Nocardia sp. XZ_19_369]
MRVRIQAGDKPITITYEVQGDEQLRSAGDHVILEYDTPDGAEDDVHVRGAKALPDQSPTIGAMDS